MILSLCTLLVSGEKAKDATKELTPSAKTADLDTQEARPSYDTYEPPPPPPPPKNEYGLIHDYPQTGHGKLDEQSQPAGGYRKGVEPASGGYGAYENGAYDKSEGYDNRGPLLPNSYAKATKDSVPPYSSHG